MNDILAQMLRDLGYKPDATSITWIRELCDKLIKAGWRKE